MNKDHSKPLLTGTWTAADEAERQRDIERLNNMSDEELEAAYGVAKEDTACFHCPGNTICKYAWDPYNTDGDCLMNK